MRSAAIRHLLTAWLPELAGYGGWDNAAEYIDNMPDYRMYGLATWFYKIRSRPAWAAKLDNPAGFIIHQMDTPGAANAGLSPAERITLIGYIDEAESVVRHFQQVEF